MKKTIAVATFLALGAGTMGVSALDLKGSDTLRDLTIAVINACPGANPGGVPALNYIGGGSGAGESAMVAGTQLIAPMSRFLAGSGTGGICAVNADKAEGIEIAGDDIGLWFTQSHQAACDPGSATDNCQGYANGGISFSKTLTTGVTLTNWKDVTRLIYFGLAPNDFPLAASPVDANGEVSVGAIAQRDCQDPSRLELIASFGKLFQNNCAASGTSDTGGCIKLQHAFRRDEDSGTTDFFRETNAIESGTQFSNKGFPFCNEYVPAVTANVASVSRGACTVNTDCSTFGAGYFCLSGQCKRPNNGCTVGTTASDCPTGSTCDPGQLQCATTCAVGAAGNATCSGLIAGASCAPSGTCTPHGCTSDATCGGTAGSCVSLGATCTANANCGTGGTCSGGVCTAGTCAVPVTNCNADADCGGNSTCSHFAGTSATTSVCRKDVDPAPSCAVPGVVGGTSLTGTVAGKPGVLRSSALGVYMENQQDNDPVRQTVVGAFGFNAVGAADTNPAEQVASACGDLGVVLPISEPPINTPADQAAAFPNTLCGRGKFNFAPTIKIQGGAATRWALCPNGDMPLGAQGWDPVVHGAIGGTGNCLYPALATPADLSDLRCLNGGNNRPTVSNRPPTAYITTPATADARVYNEHVFTAPAGGTPGPHLTQPYSYNAGAQTPTPTPPDTAAQITENVVSAFYRIHSTRTTKTGADAQCQNGVCCERTADTDQIGCLVEASPCSMGYSGLAAGEQSLVTGTTTLTTSLNFAAGLNTSATGANVSPSGPNDCIPNGPAPLVQYPIARDLFVSSVAGFETLSASDPQLALIQCYSGTQALSTGTVQGLIASHGFVNLSAYPCCKDFDQSACTTHTTLDACGNNSLVNLPTAACPF